MNKLLLIMPFFMDYQNILKNEMERYYEVTLIISEHIDT